MTVKRTREAKSPPEDRAIGKIPENRVLQADEADEIPPLTNLSSLSKISAAARTI